MTTQPSGLAAALARAQAKLHDPPRAKTMQVPGRPDRQYAGLDDLLQTIRPVLAAEGIAIVQRVEVTETGARLLTELRHGDEVLSSCWPLDFTKGGPQDHGSRLTYARRYTLEALVGVAATHDDDAESAQATHQEAPKAAVKAPKKEAPKPASAKPARSPEARVRENPDGSLELTHESGERRTLRGDPNDPAGWVDDPNPSPRSSGAPHREARSPEPSGGTSETKRWTDRERSSFFGDLSRAWPEPFADEPSPARPDYEDLAAWCEAHGHPRPSGMTAARRSKLIATIRDSEAKRVEIADWIAARTAAKDAETDRIEREARDADPDEGAHA